MQSKVSKQNVQTLIGKSIYAVKKDGTVVQGKLIRISGNKLLVAPPKGKRAKTSAILPLVLFDLLAVGTAPYAYGGYGGYGGFGGYGYGGYGYGGYPYGYGFY
ncbi:hypothetical protein PAESOLCIP111_05469 [Paenibacillus solanacearum]|uniref:50S ribosomal protein L33 n=1 Tax=Paenibacillus solanacearum TaxID=2048548 RepID=A0A916K677_9BACL|nr:hypothetical protein [Paenibacillus solanacearum]CAG7647825.1 hypothetical protein PAESOLCIP111_05469 [Paenibacillus solanacearum]